MWLGAASEGWQKQLQKSSAQLGPEHDLVLWSIGHVKETGKWALKESTYGDNSFYARKLKRTGGFVPDRPLVPVLPVWWKHGWRVLLRGARLQLIAGLCLNILTGGQIGFFLSQKTGSTNMFKTRFFFIAPLCLFFHPVLLLLWQEHDLSS